MDAKQFLKQKGIFDTQYIVDCDGESIDLETLLTEYQALQLQQGGVIKSVCLLGYSFEGCKYIEPKHEACKYCDKFNQTVL